MSGSGGAPQLDEQALEAATREAFYDREGGAMFAATHEFMVKALANGIEAYLAASSGGGELDLTDEECAALLEEFESGTAPDHMLDTIEAKLRARLDRKDDDAG